LRVIPVLSHSRVAWMWHGGIDHLVRLQSRSQLQSHGRDGGAPSVDLFLSPRWLRACIRRAPRNAVTPVCRILRWIQTLRCAHREGASNSRLGNPVRRSQQ